MSLTAQICSHKCSWFTSTLELFQVTWDMKNNQQKWLLTHLNLWTEVKGVLKKRLLLLWKFGKIAVWCAGGSPVSLSCKVLDSQFKCRGFDSPHWHVCLQPWASCFTSIASSFEWDIKLWLHCVYARASKRPHQKRTVAWDGLLLWAGQSLSSRPIKPYGA